MNAGFCAIGGNIPRTREGSRRKRSIKKYIVRLTDAERATCQEVIKKLKGTSEKVRRAQILLKADADGPALTDAEIAEAFSCRTKTVENIHQRFVELGFEQTLERKKPQTPPANKLLDGRQEAQLIATRLGPPPAGYAHWYLHNYPEFSRGIGSLTLVSRACKAETSYCARVSSVDSSDQSPARRAGAV